MIKMCVLFGSKLNVNFGHDAAFLISYSMPVEVSMNYNPDFIFWTSSNIFTMCQISN